MIFKGKWWLNCTTCLFSVALYRQGLCLCITKTGKYFVRSANLTKKIRFFEPLYNECILKENGFHLLLNSYSGGNILYLLVGVLGIVNLPVSIYNL